MEPQRLFRDAELRSVLAERKLRMEQEIDGFDRNRILSGSTADLTNYFCDRYRIDPVRLANEEDMRLDDPPQEVMVDARNVPNPAHGEPRLTLRGFRYILRIPFQGYSDIFKLRPSASTSAPPIAYVEDERLVLTLDRRTDAAPEHVRSELLQSLTEIEQYLNWAKGDIHEWLPTLRQSAWERIEARKRDLSKAVETASRIGFKLRERTDLPAIFVAPPVRRRVRPAPPPQLPGSQDAYKPEPRLENEQYEHILSLISSMATVLERSPHAFATMDEESLRFVLLVPLNSHYEGETSGEAFNFEGKTDILIRVRDRTIFVAECKIWRGKEELLAAIDQLLGYTTWRDTRTAIIIFNRNKNFSAVLNQIRPVVESHTSFKRFERQISETAYRFIFKQRDDEAREMVITVLAFDVPAPSPALSSA